MKTKLSIPENEQPMAESLGAKRDKQTGQWYVEDMEELAPFLCWMDKRLLEPCRPVICME